VRNDASGGQGSEPVDGLRFPFENVPGPGVVKQVAQGIYWARLPLPLRLNHVNVWLLVEPAVGAGEGGVAEGGAGEGSASDVLRLTVVDVGLGDQTTRELWNRLLARLGETAMPVRVAPSGGGKRVDSWQAEAEWLGAEQGAARGVKVEQGAAPGVKVERIVLTHFHPDHSGAARWMAEEQGAQVLMSRGEHEQALAAKREDRAAGAWSAVDRLTPHGLPGPTRELLLSSPRPFGHLVPDVPAAVVPLAAGDRVSLGGREWRVLIGHGHSPEHVSLYSEEARLLISGDMLLPHISSHVGSPVTYRLGNPVALFEQSLKQLEELPTDTLVLPSHGVPFLGVKARVAALLAHHRERCARLLDAVTEPHTAGELLEVLFPRGLDPLQVILAMNETIAHLAYLEERGQVRQRRGPDGKIRWVRASARVW